MCWAKWVAPLGVGQELTLPAIVVASHAPKGPFRTSLRYACRACWPIRRESGENPGVIAGKKRGNHLVGLQIPWQCIRARVGLPRIRLRDLRDTCVGCLALGDDLSTIDKTSGHTQIHAILRRTEDGPVPGGD